MFIEALARLNSMLKDSTIHVVVFIIIPASNDSYNIDTLKGQAAVRKLRETVDSISQNISELIFNEALKGNIRTEALISENDVLKLKRHSYATKRSNLPPVVTHAMSSSETDPILVALRRVNLCNFIDDHIKIVFHPEFVSADNPILSLDYQDFVSGCHLGVFPSYYEPWGYTPAECIVLGIPSITTNLSGFGCFIEEHVENPSDHGVYIVDRRLKSVEESVQQLTSFMHSSCLKTRRQRIVQRNRAERLGELVDWSVLGINYKKARYLALKRRFASGQFIESPGSSEEKIAEILRMET